MEKDVYPIHCKQVSTDATLTLTPG